MCKSVPALKKQSYWEGENMMMGQGKHQALLLMLYHLSLKVFLL